ncbi:endonuclease/exonuclease/phosphatase family protein [Brachybacterium sp. FME24]|uniref:endonuclease/exonuclease/phosphatase family protein n=1 Tax=Brachybacterium sp. FME24 TaxID=2742605 RepID=UPI0018665FC6|nr:endonuclease/exonuclease/phosphatase family protein [Brachybacterium sp. FME24]
MSIRRRAVLPILAAVPLTALAAPGMTPGAQAAPPPVPLRVATYNIAAGSGGAGGDARFDLERTIGVLRSLEADVIALQEVDRHWGERSEYRDLIGEIARDLGMRDLFAPIYSHEPEAPGDPRREYGLAILSRFPVVASTNHELTRLSTQDPDPDPDAAKLPGFAEAVLEVKGARIHVYSTHLDYRGDPTLREIQVAETQEILAADGPGASRILMGDLNAPPEAPELGPLWSDLTDVWDAAGAGEGLTYPAAAPTKRIDYVTVSAGIEVLAAHVAQDDLALEASDHRPVVADLLVPRGA